MTAVVLLGRLPAYELFPRSGPLRSVDPAEAEPAALLELVAADIEDHGSVLALYPDWDGGVADYHVRLLHSALETTRLAACRPSVPEPRAGRASFPAAWEDSSFLAGDDSCLQV